MSAIDTAYAKLHSDEGVTRWGVRTGATAAALVTALAAHRFGGQKWLVGSGVTLFTAYEIGSAIEGHRREQKEALALESHETEVLKTWKGRIATTQAEGATAYQRCRATIAELKEQYTEALQTALTVEGLTGRMDATRRQLQEARLQGDALEQSLVAMELTDKGIESEEEDDDSFLSAPSSSPVGERSMSLTGSSHTDSPSVVTHPLQLVEEDAEDGSGEDLAGSPPDVGTGESPAPKPRPKPKGLNLRDRLFSLGQQVAVKALERNGAMADIQLSAKRKTIAGSQQRPQPVKKEVPVAPATEPRPAQKSSWSLKGAVSNAWNRLAGESETAPKAPASAALKRTSSHDFSLGSTPGRFSMPPATGLGFELGSMLRDI